MTLAGALHSFNRLLDVSRRVRLRSEELKQASLFTRLSSLPGILESNGTVLEFLADDLHLLEVLLTILPLLLVVHTVAACALQFLHRRAVNRIGRLEIISNVKTRLSPSE